MTKALDGSIVPDKLPALPCGGIPLFDNGSGCGYRCDTCFAVVGSIGMPKNCYDAYSASSSNTEDGNQ